MTTVLATVLSLVFLPLGLAKIAGVPVMRQAAAHLGMSTGRDHYENLGGRRPSPPTDTHELPPRPPSQTQQPSGSHRTARRRHPRRAGQ
ncbi:hypothetical protein [Streptomyces sp. NPDC096013]|uniref:hypothetical protein n=1 Tax=Streptomyces sp. NPDC096013 TaxID=3366069 RepID=UPI00381B13EA